MTSSTLFDDPDVDPPSSRARSVGPGDRHRDPERDGVAGFDDDLEAGEPLTLPTGPGVQRSFDDLGRPLHEVPFVVIDFETTGGSPQDCMITEIGAVKLQGGALSLIHI